MKKTVFSLGVLLVAFPFLTSAQTGGGMMGSSGAQSGSTTGSTQSGNMMGSSSGSGAMIGNFAGMTDDALDIGPDGTVYILGVNPTNSTQTTITAISPLASNPDQWEVSVSGGSGRVAVGTDRLVVSVYLPSTTSTTLQSKLYVLSMSTGAQLFSLNQEGIVTTLRIATVGGIQMAYVVSWQVSSTTTATATTMMKATFTIYRLDTGAVVKSVSL